MKVAILSHRGGNIGHDFMSLGMERMLRQAFGEDVELEHFEQHQHFSVLPETHPLRRLDRVPHGRLKALRRLLDREALTRWLWTQARDLSGYRLVVACGGPNIIRGAASSPEMNLMFHELYGAFSHQGCKVLDLAIGSCFPLERLPASAADAFTDQDRVTYRRLIEATSFTTVRDPLARTLMSGLGREAPVIACTAVATGRLFREHEHRLRGTELEPDHVLVNFQEKGANEDWGQAVDTRQWAGQVKAVAESLSKRHRVAFLCHNEHERRIAEALGLELPVIVPSSWQEYAAWACRAKAALVSRVHAALPMAGIGVPCLAVGTDSRLMALETVGIETLFVKRADAGAIEAALESMMANRVRESGRLEANVDAAMSAYRSLFLEWAG